MPAKRGEYPRVTGPYPHGPKWRCKIHTGPGTFVWTKPPQDRADLAWDFAQAALEAVKAKDIGPLTIGGLCLGYLERLRQRGCKEATIDNARVRLAGLLAEHEHLEVASVSTKRARAIYQALVDSGRAAAATHHKSLDYARSAWRWAVKHGMVKANPWSDIDKIGRASRGKLQLRVDEAKRLSDVCAEHMLTDDRALALLLCLMLGLRRSEVAKRVVRDVDQGCTVLVIEDPKTPNGYRRPEIPEFMRAAVRTRCANRDPGEPLLRTANGTRLYSHYLENALRHYSRLAGVPAVTPHGLRGGFATALVEAGALTHLVAAVMGHGSFENMTAKHYVDQDANDRAKQKRRLGVLDGGKK
jgi:integrase/recombinase XerC